MESPPWNRPALSAAFERPATYGFLAVCWLAYIGTLVLGGMTGGGGMSMLGPSSDALIASGSLLTPFTWTSGQWERVFACGFLHVGIIHIGFNTMAIKRLGEILEQFVGARRTLLAILLSQIFTAAAPAIWSAIDGEPQNVVGASGVACGLGATLWMLTRGVAHPGMIEFRRSIHAWLVMALLIGLVPNISFLGHLGGIVGGLLAGAILRKRGGFRPKGDSWTKNVDRVTWFLAAVAALAIGYAAVKAPSRFSFLKEATALADAARDVSRWAEGAPFDPADLPGFERAILAYDLSEPLARARDRVLAGAAKLAESGSPPNEEARDAALREVEAAIALINEERRAQGSPRESMK